MTTHQSYEKFKPRRILESLAVDPYINMKGSAWRRKIEMVATFQDESGKEFLFPVNLGDESIEMRLLYLDDQGIVRLGLEGTNSLHYKLGSSFEAAVYHYNLNRYPGEGRILPDSLTSIDLIKVKKIKPIIDFSTN